MKKLLFILITVWALVIPVSAAEFTPPAVPDSGLEYMPQDTESFADGLWFVIRSGLNTLQPAIGQACRTSLSVIAVNLLVSLVSHFSGVAKKAAQLVGTVACAVVLFQPTNSLIQLGTDTVRQISEYGKLLLPVMTAAVAAQGAVTLSATLYAGTMAFIAILTTAISKLLIPLAYIHLCLCVSVAAIGDEALKNLRNASKWTMTWGLKIILYVFTGYIAVTGVVSGATDAAALRAAKLTISGVVPVVGSILSDASEAVLVSAGVMKNAVGVYGLLAVAALWIEPFLRIGVQYLLLKVTGGVCSAVGTKNTAELVQDFSGAMGYILAMTGTVCLLILISTVCLMKGVG